MGRHAEAAVRREIRAIEDGLAWYGLDPIEPAWLQLQWQLDHLGLLGAAARLITPRLEKFCNHPNLFIRSWARDALGRITA
jgi:hypothetical protein